MLRSLFLVSSLYHLVALGGMPTVEETDALALTTERRRSDEYRDAVISIAISAGFKFRRCAKALPWESRMTKMFAGMFAGAFQGIFMNFESSDRRRFGFNVNHFLEGVAAEVDASMCNDEAAVVQTCTERAQSLIEGNRDASIAEFMSNFGFLSAGADGLMECAKEGMPSVCTGWYETLCQ